MSTRKRVSQACKPCNQKKIKVWIASERAVCMASSNFDRSAMAASHNAVHARIRTRSVHMAYRSGGSSMPYNAPTVADFATEGQIGGQNTMG